MTQEKTAPEAEETAAPNFVLDEIQADVDAGKNDGKVVTRFPPEPNGYLHIGHAKAICVDFGMAERFGGKCNLRFDDTNPSKESTEFVEAIQRDVRWLGYQWDGEPKFASDYFDQFHDWAIQLIKAGKAYVDSLTPDEIREYRGNFHAPGKDSPHRNRSVEENLDLFARMKAGEFDDGQCVLRAKIDMASPNLNLRDPLLYRIMKEPPHHRMGNKWCIYPMYDFAHGQGDALEGVTHSLCTLEFENHRPLYEWFLEALELPHHPRQIEFSALNLSYTVLSKRKLRQLVEDGHVSGWDDPRMPTLAGFRRRGAPPVALRRLVDRLGVSKREGVADVGVLEYEIREELNATAPRYMAVLRPLKLVITNYPEGEEEFFDAPLHPGDESYGTRKVPFCRELYIERDDFREEAPRKWFRFAPGKEVRLRYACLVTCNEVIKDENGEVVELRCTWDPESRGGNAPDGRRVRGTSHWVSARHGRPLEARIYDRLFAKENPLEDDDFLQNLNPDSLEVVSGGVAEPALAELEVGKTVQFERLGYYCLDPDTSGDTLVFNRTIALKDSWAKLEKKLKG